MILAEHPSQSSVNLFSITADGQWVTLARGVHMFMATGTVDQPFSKSNLKLVLKGKQGQNIHSKGPRNCEKSNVTLYPFLSRIHDVLPGWLLCFLLVSNFPHVEQKKGKTQSLDLKIVIVSNP